MKQNVVLSIRGEQAYAGQEPDVIELVTDGILEKHADGWDLSYEETALTGMEGVTTTFTIAPDRIILTRTGKLNSQMVFQEGITHDSLYRMDFGALMLSVTAQHMDARVGVDGGTIDLTYRIEIEQTGAGVINYHLEITPKL